MSWLVKGYVRKPGIRMSAPNFERIVSRPKDITRALLIAEDRGCDEFLIIRRGERDNRKAAQPCEN